MNKTKIGWTDFTWNTTSGCTKVSPGCEHCYAEAISLRFGRSQHPWTKPYEAKNVKLHPERLLQPFKLAPGSRVFVDSMSDLFHELVPYDHIVKVFGVMEAASQVTFQILTKRPERMNKLISDPVFEEHVAAEADTHRGDGPWGDWPLKNVWLGTSTEDQRRADERIPWLVSTAAAVRFLSCEPILGAISLRRWLGERCWECDGSGDVWFPSLIYGPDERVPCTECDGGRIEATPSPLHWIITGGESGPNFRPADPDWFRSIRDQCTAAGVAYFHKQGSGRLPERDRELDGRTWDEMPGVRS